MQALISPLKELAEFQQMKEELKRGSAFVQAAGCVLRLVLPIILSWKTKKPKLY